VETVEGEQQQESTPSKGSTRAQSPANNEQAVIALQQEVLDGSDTESELTPLANRASQTAAESATGVVKRRLAYGAEKVGNTQLSKQHETTNTARKVHKGHQRTPTRTNTQLTPTKPAEPHSGQQVGKRKIIPVTQ
jgi:hypothetical protein